MIAETRECSKCKRELPLKEFAKGHEAMCKGIVAEDAEGTIYESNIREGEENNGLKPLEDIPFYFRTRSQKMAELDEEYPEVLKKFCRENSVQSYQEQIDHRDKNVSLFNPKTVLCPKCSEAITLENLPGHTCSYCCCDFCQEYYPQEIMENHREYCYHNPYRRYENPYSQNKKEREGMDLEPIQEGPTGPKASQELGPISRRPESENEIISTQQELVSLPDGNQVVRTIIKRPHGYSVEERRVRRQPQTTTVGGQSNVVLNPLPAFHQSHPQPVTVSEQQPTSEARRSRPGSMEGMQGQPRQLPPQQPQRQNIPYGQPMGQQPQAQSGFQVDLFNPLGAFFGQPSGAQMGYGHGGMQDAFNPVMQFMPQRNLFDNFGSFFMFGQNPFDPMMQNRSFHSPFSPFDSLLRDHVNFVRVNRNRMFDPNFVVILLDNNANAQTDSQNTQRLQKEQLNQIPVTKFVKKPDTKPGEEEKCPICLIDLENSEEIRSLPCKHIFHPGCIDTWLVKNSSCPICKRDVLEGIGAAPRPDQPGAQQQQRPQGQANRGNPAQQGGLFDLLRPGSFF